MKKKAKKDSKVPPFSVESKIDNNDQLHKNKNDKFELISFDLKTKIFLGICLLLFVVGVWGKYNFSHSSIWYQLFGDNLGAKKNILLGKPHTIRSDEWLVDVPSYFSQSENNYSIYNPSIGPGSSTVIQGLPVKNIITIFRPLHWGFFLFDIERGISWLWMWRTIGCLVSVFLFLKILTRNNFLLSIFGSLFVFTSSGIQWWGIFTEPISFASLACIGLLGLIFSKNLTQLLIYGSLFLVFSFSFVVTPLYPPRQVPVMYLVAILTITFIVKNYNREIIFNNLKITKYLVLSICALSTTSLLLYFYLLNKETIEIVSNTVYPGRRVSLGGDLDWTKLFSEFYWLFLDADKIPQKWANICEASGFILFFPIIFYSVIKNYIYKKPNNLAVVSICIYIIFSLVYMIIGLPKIVVQLTFLGMSPPFRFLYGFGIANIFLLVLFLNSDDYKILKLNNLELISIAISSFGFIYLNGIFTNEHLDDFFTSTQILVASVLFSILYTLIFLSKSNSIFIYIFLTGVLLFNIKNIGANPLSKTFEQFTKNELRRTVKDIVKEDKEAGWIVFGNQMILSNYIKSSGANVWSGVKYAPLIEKLKIIDPQRLRDSVYNRYAHTVYLPYISQNDSVIFNLAQTDMYSVGIDPCSEKLREIGIKYFVFTYQPQDIEVRCMNLISSNGILIYKAK